MEDTAENRLKKTLFIVEATSCEQHTLWNEWANKDNTYWPQKVKTWEQINGWLIQIGKLDNRPLCILTSFVKIDGQLVMFYYNCSQVTDSVKTDKWLKKYFKGKWNNGTRYAHSDAMNFHLCIQAIREANGES